MITQDKIKGLLNYDPETGVFTWAKSRKGCTAGKIAGGLRSNGYIYIRIEYGQFLAHRLAWLYMTGKMPAKHIDHINHKRDDNKWANLRQADHSVNGRNISMPSRNTSGYVGVHWNRSAGKWESSITVDGKNKYLGIFESKEEAAAARKDANKKYGYHPNHGVSL